MPYKGKLLLGLIASVSPVAVAAQTMPTSAQSGDPAMQAASQANTNEIPELVVTARRTARGEQVQKVPLAITALNGETLAQSRVVSFEDVGRLAPNVQLQPASTASGFANFTIRGIGLQGSTPSIDPAVNIIVDGMVYEFPIGIPLDTFALSSIEIMRGPQGILFGRNSTGGAVSVNTAPPTASFEAAGEVTLGNGGRRDFAATISGPIAGDWLTGRMTVIRRGFNGLIKDRNGGSLVPTAGNANVLPSGGIDTSEQGGNPKIDQWILRPYFEIKATDNLSIKLIGEHAFDGGHGNGARAIRPNPTLASYFGITLPTGAYAQNTSTLGYLSLKSDRISAEVNWDVGFGLLTSITGWRNVNKEDAFASDGTPLLLFAFPRGNTVKSRQFSEEIRFASTFSDSLEIVAGGYYSNSSMDILDRRILYLPSVGLANPPIYIRQGGNYRQDSETKAIFANVNYKLASALSLSFGGRYTVDQKEISGTQISACPGTDFSRCPTAQSTAKKSWNNFSPRVALDYQVTPDILVYASYTSGFRSGNYNNRATTAASFVTSANPEKVQSYEAGFKSMFFDRRFRFNLAAYKATYKEIQFVLIPPGSTAGFLLNAAVANLKGLEIDASLRPFGGLQLDGSFGYIDAKYDQFTPGALASLQALGIPDPTSLAFARVAKYTAYGAASYVFNLDADTKVTPRMSYSWRSSMFIDIGQTVPLPSYGLVDASLTVDHGPYSAQIWAKNLTNKDYFDFGSRFATHTAVNGGFPRSYGLTLRARY